MESTLQRVGSVMDQGSKKIAETSELIQNFQKTNKEEVKPLVSKLKQLLQKVKSNPSLLLDSDFQKGELQGTLDQTQRALSKSKQILDQTKAIVSS